MKISPNNGATKEEFLPTGRAQEAQGYDNYLVRLSETTGGAREVFGDQARFPVIATAATEVVKGQRRLMLKLMTEVPKSAVMMGLSGTTTGSVPMMSLTTSGRTKDAKCSVHLVIDVDDELWKLEASAPQHFRDPTTFAWEYGVHGIVNRNVRRLLALAGLDDVNRNTKLDEVTLTPVVRGLQGLAPLDVVNGDYGTSIDNV